MEGSSDYSFSCCILVCLSLIYSTSGGISAALIAVVCEHFVQWAEEQSQIQNPPAGSCTMFCFSFQGGAGGGGNCWVCHPLSVPSVSGPRVAIACCGSCLITMCWMISYMGVSTGTFGSNTLKGHRLWWGYCSSARISNQDIPHQQQHVSSFGPFQSDVIVKAVLILDSSVLWTTPFPAWTATCELWHFLYKQVFIFSLSWTDMIL